MADDANMTTDETTEPTQEITVQGMVFIASAPYKAGDILTANEAVALNQTYGENLRNNFAGRIKKIKDKALEEQVKAWEAAGSEGAKPTEGVLSDAAVADLRNAWDEYASTYEFNGRRIGRQQGDPVEREARSMAKAFISQKMREATPPVDTKTVTDERWDELINQVLTKYPDFRAQAKVRVDAKKAIASADVDFKV